MGDAGQRPGRRSALSSGCAGARGIQPVECTADHELAAAKEAVKSIHRTIFDSLTDPTAVIDTAGVIIAVNRAWRHAGPETALGLAVGRLREGVNYISAIEQAAGGGGRETEREALAGIRDILAGRRDGCQLAFSCRSNDARRWFVMAVTPLAGSHGGAVIAHRDITELKRRLDRNRASDHIVSSLIAAYPDSGALLSVDGTVLDISQTTAFSLNTTRVNAIGRRIYDLLPPELAEARKRHAERVAATGMTSRFRDTRNGKIFDNTIYPIFDASGEVAQLVVYGKDVTGMVEAQQQLAKKNRELQTILDALPQMVAYADKALVYRFVNRTYEAVFHTHREAIVGRRVPDVIGARAWRSVGRHVRKALQGNRVSYDETLHYPHGDPRQIHGELIPETNSTGTPDGYFAVLSDVTDLARSLERARTREKEVAALLQASRAIYEENTFDAIARRIFDVCSDTIGSRSGYVAMRSEDGQENQLLFLEAGGRPCSVDPELPMPIRGLREAAYRTSRPVYDNDFHHSRWMAFMPPGHVRLDNVLFAPMIVAGRAVGLIGIANKPTDFTENDARLAGAFADLTAVAFKRIQDEHLLRDSETELRLLTSRLMAAQENERRRIAAELHDDLGQALMVLKLELRAAVNGMKDGRPTAIDDFDAALEAINDITENLRRISRELSPSVLENFGLVPALQWLTDQYARHFDIRFDADGVSAIEGLTREAETAVFRICQEAMTNTVRHAEADAVRMHLQVKNSVLAVSIADNGRGFDVQAFLPFGRGHCGLGLRSIVERAGHLNARLDIDSKRGGGTAIMLEVPLAGDGVDGTDGNTANMPQPSHRK